VIFGRASGFGALFDLALLDGTNGFQISGIGIEDHSGAAVSGAGDVNGDGIDDLIVGADGADPHGLESGTSYIIFGSADIASRFSNTATVTITIKGQNERVDGSAAADTLVGSSLGDALFGLAGNDDLSGLGGNDLFFGGKGDDLLHGGDGVDTAVYSEATSAVVVDLATGLAQGGGGADQLDGIENLTGSRFDDTLSGFQGGNLLDGGVGNDLLSGFGGNDILIGGKGADILIGGAGADVMTGGKDADIFRFAVLSHSNATFRDRITDFSSQDSLDLSLLDGDAGTAGDQAFHLVGLGIGDVIIAKKMQHAMGHQVLQVMGERLGLILSLPQAGLEGQGHVPQMMFRVLGGRKGQDIGGLVLVAELLVQLMNGRVICQKNHHPALGPRSLEGGLSGSDYQGLDIGQGTAPGLRLDLDLDQGVWLRLAASAS
jgi:Ca2+-binding RTX toxin-like protein